MKTLKFLLLLTSILLLSCGSKAPKLARLKEDKQPIIEKNDNPPRFTLSSAEVDVLFIIDNSGSMGIHQGNLALNINLFVNSLDNAITSKYQYGIISSDKLIGGGKLLGEPRFINDQTTNKLQDLEKNLIIGVDGAGKEMFFEPIQMALSSPLIDGHNSGFLRKGAHLALIFLTDTNDQGMYSAPEMHDFLYNQVKGGEKEVIAYGALNNVGIDLKCPGESREPTKIKELIKLTDGSFFSLCNEDFGEQIAKIADHLAERTSHLAVTLDQTPQINTIEVWYGKQEIVSDRSKGWEFDPERNMLIFGPNLDLNEQQQPKPKLKMKFLPAKIGAKIEVE